MSTQPAAHTFYHESPSHPDSHNMSSQIQPNNTMTEDTKPATTTTGGHNMHPDDPDNPQNWSIISKVYASFCSASFAFAVAFALTCYTSTLPTLQKVFKTDMTTSILGFSLFLFGVAFSPIHTPHLSERFGRRPIYFASGTLFSFLLLGTALSRTWTALMVTRFFAGLTGGPSLVLIEGTFADVWSGDATVTYYVFLTLASFIGAATGPVVGGFIPAEYWRWSVGWIPLLISIAALLLGIGMPETYPREILRSRAKRTGATIRLAPAQSGVTIAQMAKHTLINPVKMLVAEPIVVMLSLYVGFLFAVIFQFFILIPVVLTMTYKFKPYQVGLAFTSAIGGSLLAALIAVLLDLPSASTRPRHGKAPQLEYRLRSGMLGGILVAGSLFWIAWTADPMINHVVPIAGTAIFITGSVLVLTSAISYIFDAYPAPGTLAALTAAACFRIVLAGIIPLVVIQMVMGLGGAWAVSTFGFIAAALMAVPWVLYYFGARLRERSSYNKGMMNMMMSHGSKDVEM